MVVFHNLKCIFIHIPKTAGTSIEQFIKDNGKNEISYLGVRNNRSLHHLLAYELKLELSYLYNQYYKFSIIRNPYDRLLSEYYWTPIRGVGYKSNQTKADFITYVAKVVKNKLFFENIYNDHFIPQHCFVFKGKNLLVDHIFRYEDLDYIIDFLKKRFNINRNFPCLNKSDHSIKKTEWNNRQKERIYKIYEKDFIIFNYSK